MRLLDFFTAWNTNKTDKYLHSHFPAEWQESLDRKWTTLLPDMCIYITESGLQLFWQLSGNFTKPTNGHIAANDLRRFMQTNDQRRYFMHTDNVKGLLT